MHFNVLHTLHLATRVFWWRVVSVPDKYQWVFATQSSRLVDVLSSELRVSPLIARLLCNRGIRTPEDGNAFLRPSLSQLHDPMQLTGMDKAVSRLRQAIEKKEHIRIAGDYDVDGTTSTALLSLFFNLVGATHSYTIPSREEDGYGLSMRAVEKAHADGRKVLITVDNGVTAVEEVRRAQALGIDVIITDHHSWGQELPPAYVIIHPKLPGQTYPFKDLCGCGVAFKLALAVARSFGSHTAREQEFAEFLHTAYALTAIASICDVVPLKGENRVLTSTGLGALASTRHAGLRALLETAELRGEVTGMDIAFKVGPRINAAGRMGQEQLAARLLLTRDFTEAMEMASQLDGLNRQRQGIERGVTKSAKELMAADSVYEEERVIVLAGSEWTQGVIGIVAARMVEATGKPAIVLSVNAKGEARGSGRSTKNFHLYNALARCEKLMLRFGGHAAAVGISMMAENIPSLRRAVNEVAPAFFAFESAYPTLDIEAVADASDLNVRLAHDVASLGPFGEGNPQPLFAIEDCKTAGRPRLVGKTSRHLAFQVVPGQGRGLHAIARGMADRLSMLANPRGIKVAFTPRISTFYGSEQLELEVKDLASA